MTDGVVVTPSSTLLAQLLGIAFLFYLVVYKPIRAFVPRHIGDPIIGIASAALLVFLLVSPIVREHVLTTLHLTQLK